MYCSTENKAPWPDFVCKPIFEGDRIVHPSGEIGRVKYYPDRPRESDQWFVDYGDGTESRLVLQIGDRGEAIVHPLRNMRSEEMSEKDQSFLNLEVRKFDGEEWPEKRVSIGDKQSGLSVMISPRYADLEQAEVDARVIVHHTNNYLAVWGYLEEAISHLDQCAYHYGNSILRERADEMREFLDSLEN